MDLKNVLDNYEQGAATLLDIGLILTEECGTGDSVQVKRAIEIIYRDCPVK